MQASVKVELVCIVDTHRPSGEALAGKYGVQFFEQLDEACVVCSPDAVWIGTPTPYHSDAIKAIAARKLPMFVEKPVAASPDEVCELFSICRDAGVTLCCGFQRRFDASYVAVKKAVQEGKIGTPLMCTVMCGDHPVPSKEFLKLGGDPFMDLSPHDIDFVRNTLQDEVEDVSARGTSSTAEMAEIGVIDNAVVSLRFRRGTICTLLLSRGATYGYDQRCEFFGDGGQAQVADQHENSCIIKDATGIHMSRLANSFPQRFSAAFAAEVDTFADVCLGIAEWPVSERDCATVQAIAQAASASAAEGGRHLKVALPERLSETGR